MNLLKATAGLFYFVAGWIYAGVAWYTVPVFIALFDSTILQGIFWLGLITIWVLLVVILPANYIIQAMKE